MALLQPRVPLGAHPGEDGDLLAAEPRDAPPAAAREQTRLLGGDPGATACQEVADVGAVVHPIDGTARRGSREVELLPPTNPTSHARTRRRSVESDTDHRANHGGPVGVGRSVAGHLTD
jgi:hypothetical protein